MVGYNQGIEKNASEDDDLASSPPSYDIVTYPADYTLEGLVPKLKDKSIHVPKFQRKYVWNIKQASRLIESFLLDLPVPAVFFYVEQKSNNLLVIDGQQRLRAIENFFNGYFGSEGKIDQRTAFKLTGLNKNSPYYNKTYADLKAENPTAYKKLNNSILRAFLVKQLAPKNNTSMYHIFERLNTGGVQLVGQEIRNCIYHGPFNNLLCELNRNGNWRKIFGSQTVHRRQRDVELILRFFSFYDGGKYTKPLKDFMSRFMLKNRDLKGSKLKRFQDIFIDTCEKTVSHLGVKPFHISTSLNVAAFDSVFTTLAKNGFASDVKNRYKKLIKDEKFTAAIREATTDESVVKSRMSLAKKYLVE